MNVDVINKQKVIPVSEKQVIKLVETVIAFEDDYCDEVSIYFVETEEICALHEEFFDDPTTTDCISFPIDDELSELVDDYRVLGDVFVCPQTALDYAAEHKKLPLHEVTLYIVHGLLHLMGYDDIEEDDRVEMRAAEERHMANLEKSGLVLTQ